MRYLFLAIFILFSFPVSASQKTSSNKDNFILKLSPASPLSPGKEVEVIANLKSKDGKPVTFDDLKIVHTKKFHLLIIDPTLTDYHHVHPEPTKTPGEYKFRFTPKNRGIYRAWADITSIKDGHAYVIADMGAPAVHKPVIKKITSYNAVVDGYKFSLTFDSRPKVGKASLGRITAKDKNDKPVTNFEPVLGAFAHIVGFTDDYRSIQHMHPMGKEPESEDERGGPELLFHFAPSRKGFVKLFAQIRINGKDIFVPFGVKVR